MKLRNWMAMFIVVAIALMMVVPSSNTVQAFSKVVKVEVPKTPVKLTWFYPGSRQPDQDKVFAEANKIIRKKLNATVDFLPIEIGAFNDKVSVRISAGDPVDLCYTSYWLFNYEANVAKQAFVDTEPLLKKYGKNILAQVPASFFECLRIKGHIYAVLNKQYFADDIGIWFKKDLAVKYGLVDKIKNAKYNEDLTPVFQTIKDKEPGVYPLSGPYRLKTLHPGERRVRNITNTPFGVYADDPQLKLINAVGLPQTMKDYKIAYEWYTKGFLPTDVMGITDTSADEKAGKYFTGIIGKCKPGGDQEKSQELGFDVIVKSTGDPVLTNDSATATMTAIPVTSKNPERAMMLLDLLHTDKQLYNLICFGIEGLHYTKIDNNTIDIVKNSKFNAGNTWALGNVQNTFLLKGQPANRNQMIDDWNKSAKVSPLYGFTMDLKPIRVVMANLNNITGKTGKSLNMGVVDPEVEVPKYLAKMEKAGEAKAMKEIQSQIYAWKANKKK